MRDWVTEKALEALDELESYEAKTKNQIAERVAEAVAREREYSAQVLAGARAAMTSETLFRLERMSTDDLDRLAHEAKRILAKRRALE